MNFPFPLIKKREEREGGRGGGLLLFRKRKSQNRKFAISCVRKKTGSTFVTLRGMTSWVVSPTTGKKPHLKVLNKFMYK